MEFLSIPLQKVFDWVVEPVKRQLDYIFFYKSKVEELQKCAENVRNKREVVQRDIEAAENNGEEIFPGVGDWLAKVNVQMPEVDNCLNNEGHARTGCSVGLFPRNLQMRHQLGRRATKMAEQVDGLLREYTFDRVSYRPSPPNEDDDFLDNDHERFPSRKETMEKIIKALEDSTVKIIGVHGPGGVGKTTLVRQIAKEARDKKLFNVVIIAMVSKNPDLKNIQGQIADKLGLRFDEESEAGRASRLRDRLKKEKENILVILDDLWEGLNLTKLGIPYSDDEVNQWSTKDTTNVSYFNQRSIKDTTNVSYKVKEEKPSVDVKSCKILLTSRNKHIYTTQMDIKEDSIFSLDVLKEEEAETLIKSMAGVSTPTGQKLLEEIVKKCEGLPVAIVSIGRAIRNKSESEWGAALPQLTGVQEVMKFSTKMSYDHLENEQLKSAFLLCARMSHDLLIMDLVKYCIGLGIFEMFYTIREARERIIALINKLKDSNLLMNSHSTDHVTMHDLVRDAALTIASQEQHVFTMRNGKLYDWLDEDKLVRYTTIALHYCDFIDALPPSMNCPHLKVFHLDSKDPFLRIPDKLFKAMRKLKVLILTSVHLLPLPSSIKHLTKLKMLRLEQCVLGDNLSIIGELKELKILSFSGSTIEKLPSELTQLNSLQLFDISNCSKLRLIPPNVLSSLSSLEELYMRSNLIQWAVEGQTNQCASLAELRYLHQLTALDLHIPNVAALPRNLFFDKLDSYKIVIGDIKTLSIRDFKMPAIYEASRALVLQLKEGNDIHFQKGIKMLLESVENLFLGELDGVQSVFYELNLEGFPYLKQLIVMNNFDIQYIINSREGFHPLKAFPELELMCLYKIENMEKICDNELTDVSFRKLKTLKIKKCGRLKNLFSFHMVRLFSKLETIEVSECDYLEEIVSMERQDNDENSVKEDMIVFPQLRSLTLASLPAFTCFCTSNDIVSIPHSKDKKVPNEEQGETSTKDEHGVTAWVSLFNVKVLLPNLESLELSSINTHKIWSDQLLMSDFQNLINLSVKNCDCLSSLLSISMARSLVKLQNLCVSGCEMMEDLFTPKEISINVEKIDVFPKLKKMEITSMEKLKTIWHAQVGLHSFHSLDTLIIEECHKLVTVFPNYMAKRFGTLGVLRITNCMSMEEIFKVEDCPHSDSGHDTSLWDVCLEVLPSLKHIWNMDPRGILNFTSLQYVVVFGCPQLENLFPVSVANGLEKLKCLFVSVCVGMKEIVARDEESKESTFTFKFPQLHALFFEQLPELGSFYWGTHTLEWPALKSLYVAYCNKLQPFATEIIDSQSIFIVEKVIPNLELLHIGEKEAKWLHDYISNIYHMQNIKSLILDGLKSIDILFWFLHRIPNLESLELVDCLFKEVLPHGCLPSHGKIGKVVQLKEIALTNLIFLQNIGFECDPILQRVERLVLDKCNQLINLGPSSVSFTLLTYLEISKCNRLKYLVASSTAKSLVHLSTMKVIKCEMMEEIVTEEGIADEIVFSKLMTLELVSLINLTSFCSSQKHAFRFPLLDKLTVRDCPKMRIFSGRISKAPNLQRIYVLEEDPDKWYWEGELEATILKLFKDQFALENCETLNLSSHPGLEEVWHGRAALTDNSFGNLKTLVVANCEFLKDHVIPSTLLPQMKNLEELEVRGCSAAKVVFDASNMEKIIAFCLKKLTLDQLPNLQCVWNKCPNGILIFQNLREVEVTNCGGLKSVFPAVVAKNLVKLEALEIGECEALVEIVGKEEAAQVATEQFMFPCLTSLKLYKMPELRCFYPASHNLECRKLTRLEVFLCGKLKILASGIQSQLEADAEDHRKALFLVEKVIAHLEALSLNEKDTKMLWHGQFPAEMLHNIKELDLCFGDANNNEVASLPFGFLEKVPNLEVLEVGHFSSLKEIFPPQKLEDDDIIRILARLQTLSLYSLCMLNSIGLEHSWLNPFCNLKKLNVNQCHGLAYIFTSSTAKTLVQLEVISIWECDSMKEIVAKEGDESTSDEIKFERLTTLFLRSLSNLESFYSGPATLRFSSLEHLVVIIDCPRMKTFSQGLTNAPRFRAVINSLDGSAFRFKDDLNTTVENLFQEKVAEFACNVQHLIFGDHPELEDIWRGLIPVPDKCFGNLKSMVVNECQFLSAIIPSHLLPFLSKLEELEVRNCDSIKVIFDVKDAKGLSFPIPFALKKLTLDQLPNLEHVWDKDPQASISHEVLQEVLVKQCESLKSLFPASVAKDLAKLETLDVENCGALVEIIVEDETSTEEETKEFVFPCVTLLRLGKLPELKCFYPGIHKVEWPMLKQLLVHHCDKLEIVTSEFQCCQEANQKDQVGVAIDQRVVISAEEVLPNLEQLTLRKEDAMKIWHHRQFQGMLLQKLKLLELECFHSESDIFPFGFLPKVPNIEMLIVNHSSFKEIFSSEGPNMDHIGFLSQLKELTLHDLALLNSIGLEHSWLHPILDNIQKFEVCKCPCLINLVPSTSTVSFSNLTHLTVSQCCGLEYLFTSSTAKNLALLKRIFICKCESIEEIMAKEEEESVQDQITFYHLKTLFLKSLSSLGSFYTGNSTLKLPSLEKVSIIKCPKMKIFCQGDLSAPKLSGVKFQGIEDGVCWEGDLNTTIQKAFEEAP